jgi:HEAT repeat protein
MSTLTLVIVVTVVIGSAIVAVLATVGMSSLVRAHRIRIEPMLLGVRQAIVTALAGDESDAIPALTGLRWFPRRYITGVLLDLAPSVTGTSRSALVSMGEAIGVIRQARRGVHSRRWATRLYSARVLAAFGIESDAMVGLLGDVAPEVRAQAAAWTVVTPNPAAIDLLIHLLGDADGLCRFAARDALIRIGLPCSDALIRALGVSDVSVTDQILEIASAMGDDRFFPAAMECTTYLSATTRALAATLVARTGDRGAGPALVDLLGDPSDKVVLAAAAGIGKLGFWPAAAAVEPLLGSPSWELRRQAGLTLLDLGAPGTILLWANAPGDGETAEMAIQVLQLHSIDRLKEAA